MVDEIYDLLIIGGGPAGYSAAIYAQRYKLKILMIAGKPGGIAQDAHLIENYPGVISKTGMDLMQDFKNHAESYGLKIEMKEVVDIKKKEEIFNVKTNDNIVYKAKFILLGLGLQRRKLNVPGEDEFLGRGVSYCATCDAFFYKNKVAAVVGGSDSATMASILLSDIAEKVYLIYRKNKLRGEPIWVERAENNPKIEIIYETNVTKINGEKLVRSVDLDNGRKLDVNGIFIEIGSIPSASLAKELGVELDDKGYIKVDERQETNVKGVYAAGDITTASNKFKQVITAASEGAIAAESVYKENLKK